MFIKIYRERAGLTQVEVSMKLGITPSAFNQYEKGKRKTPIDILIKLSDLFGCTIDELVRGEKKC